MKARKIILISVCSVFIILFIMGFYSIFNLYNISTNTKFEIGDNFISDIAKDVLTTEQFNILIAGADVENNLDSVIVLNFDPDSTKINILSIPKDTKIKNSESQSGFTKINTLYKSYIKNDSQNIKNKEKGMEFCVEKVEELLNLKIRYFSLVELSSFRNLVDELGGVDINIPCKMDYDDPSQDLHIHFNEGNQTLNGLKSEEYLRYLISNSKEANSFYDGTEIKRLDSMQKFLLQLFKQKISISNMTNITKASNILLNSVTNLKSQNFIDFSKVISKLSSDNVLLFKINGEEENTEDNEIYLNFSSVLDSNNNVCESNKILKNYFMQESKINKIDTQDSEVKNTPIKTSNSKATKTKSVVKQTNTPEQTKIIDSKTNTPLPTTKTPTITPQISTPTPSKTKEPTTEPTTPTPTHTPPPTPQPPTVSIPSSSAVVLTIKPTSSINTSNTIPVSSTAVIEILNIVS